MPCLYSNLMLRKEKGSVFWRGQNPSSSLWDECVPFFMPRTGCAPNHCISSPSPTNRTTESPQHARQREVRVVGQNAPDWPARRLAGLWRDKMGRILLPARIQPCPRPAVEGSRLQNHRSAPRYATGTRPLSVRTIIEFEKRLFTSTAMRERLDASARSLRECVQKRARSGVFVAPSELRDAAFGTTA